MFQLLNLDEQFDLDSFLNISQYQARIHSESLWIILNHSEPNHWTGSVVHGLSILDVRIKLIKILNKFPKFWIKLSTDFFLILILNDSISWKVSHIMSHMSHLILLIRWKMESSRFWRSNWNFSDWSRKRNIFGGDGSTCLDNIWNCRKN